MERRNFSGLWIALMLVLLSSGCLGAPSFNPKPSWREAVPLAEGNGAPPILTSSCDPSTGRCYDWLPVVEAQPGLDDYAIEQDPEYESYRPQPIHTRNVEQVAELWRDAPPPPAYAIEPREASVLHQPTDSGNQMTGSRLAKKDMFMSRGWGAGGMPFSVLYMSPRANHPTSTAKHPNSAGPEKSADSSRRSGGGGDAAPAAGRGNGRVAVRNGSFNNQSRRHYSIIPQLFISYGWGPSGNLGDP